MPDDVSTTVFTPKTNNFLLGHEKEEKMLLEAWKNNSLHNSWLFCGIEGIGKATLAYRFARFLLSADDKEKSRYNSLDVGESNQVFKLVANNSHPDLKIIERDYTDTDRKKILKAIKDGEQLSDEEMKGLKRSAFIRVDDVRTINEFLSKKSSNDSWRVVIIDSIDDMNPASANAVLKILEEPPAKTVMLLISHNPNRLLPTIKSRCAKLNLHPLEENTVASLLRRYRSQLSEKEVKGLAKICSGSIGKAINYADNSALNCYDDLCKIIYAKSKFSIAGLLAFCEAAVQNEESYYLVQELILKFLSENIKSSDNVEALGMAWDNAVKSFDLTERLNLDKKQTLINVITNICKAI